MLAHTNVLMPDGGASALVQAAIGCIRAMPALLPDRGAAAEALSWGLVSAVHPAADFDAGVDKLIHGCWPAQRRLLPRRRTRSMRPRSPSWVPPPDARITGQALLRTDDFAEGATATQQRWTPCSPAVEFGPLAVPRGCVDARVLLRITPTAGWARRSIINHCKGLI